MEKILKEKNLRNNRIHPYSHEPRVLIKKKSLKYGKNRNLDRRAFRKNKEKSFLCLVSLLINSYICSIYETSNDNSHSNKNTIITNKYIIFGLQTPLTKTIYHITNSSPRITQYHRIWNHNYHNLLTSFKILNFSKLK